jgi:hypothetical protein
MTIQAPQNLLNLVQKGYLKEAPEASKTAEVYFSRANGSLESSQTAGIRSHDRFVIAYEGLFALAVGVLALYDLRPGDGEGHRVTALQGALGTLGLNPGQMALASRIHEQRNAKIYKLPLDASEGDAKDAASILDAALTLAVAMKVDVQRARAAAQSTGSPALPALGPSGKK